MSRATNFRKSSSVEYSRGYMVQLPDVGSMDIFWNQCLIRNKISWQSNHLQGLSAALARRQVQKSSRWRTKISHNKNQNLQNIQKSKQIKVTTCNTASYLCVVLCQRGSTSFDKIWNHCCFTSPWLKNLINEGEVKINEIYSRGRNEEQ